MAYLLKAGQKDAVDRSIDASLARMRSNEECCRADIDVVDKVYRPFCKMVQNATDNNAYTPAELVDALAGLTVSGLMAVLERSVPPDQMTGVAQSFVNDVAVELGEGIAKHVERARAKN